MSEDLRLSVAVEKAEKAHIRLVLDQTNWNRTKAARILGISYRTMFHRTKRYGFGREGQPAIIDKSRLPENPPEPVPAMPVTSEIKAAEFDYNSPTS